MAGILEFREDLRLEDPIPRVRCSSWMFKLLTGVPWLGRSICSRWRPGRFR